MEQTDVRRAALRQFVAAEGGHAAVVARYGLSQSQASYLSQITTPKSKAAFGERSARGWEERFRLARGFLDQASLATGEGAMVPTGQVAHVGIDHAVSNLEAARHYPATLHRAPVVGTARLGDDGFYEEFEHPVGHGDGWVESYSSDPNVYALRVKGDSMHPAIRHGQFVVVEPNGACMPGEYVVLQLTNGKKMVKELMRETATEVVIESVNGNHRQTLDRADIARMHPVSSVVASSKWREV